VEGQPPLPRAEVLRLVHQQTGVSLPPARSWLQRRNLHASKIPDVVEDDALVTGP
jgi:hypothetical protein